MAGTNPPKTIAPELPEPKKKENPPVADGPRVMPPDDLPGSLKYLDAAQLQRLSDAVTVEIDRRSQAAATKIGAKKPQARSDPAGGVDDVPPGKATLIRAWFKAGVKPAAIAREFRISPALVNRILGKPSR